MRHIKQWHHAALVAAFLSVVCYATAEAYNFSAGNIYYNINEKTQTAEVTSASDTYNSYSGQVVIPATVTSGGKTYKVTAVGDNAFRDCVSLTGVTFGSNVATIGKRAFLNCSALTAVNITEAVTGIDDYAFAQCEALKTVLMKNDTPLQVGNGAFMRCSSLSKVRWQSCESLEGRGGLTTLGTGAFAHCTSLTAITLPGLIDYLGASIFEGCTKLSSVTVTADHPLVLTSDPFALSGTTTIYVPSTGNAGESAVLYRNAMGWSGYTIAELPYSFIDGEGYTYLKTSAGSVALLGCQDTKSEIKVRDAITGYGGENYYVTSIANRAFKDAAITILNTGTSYHLKTVGDESFAGCAYLTNVSLIEGITAMGERAFASCTALTSIMLPSTLRTVPKGAFDGCSSLNNVSLLMGVTTISENAFAHCTSLTMLRLPSSLTEVEPNALMGTTALEDFVVAPGNPYFAVIDGVLYETRYGENPVDEEVNVIYKLVIYPSGKADEVLYIPPSVIEIKANAINNATFLKQVAIPPTTTIFGENCFDGTSLQYINYRCKQPVDEGTAGITAALKANTTLQVPEGAESSYRALDAWKGFKNIVERYDVLGDSKFVYDWNSRNEVTLVDIKSTAVSSSGVVTLPLQMILNGRNYYITELRNTATAQVAQQVKTLKIACDSLCVIDLNDDINPLAALTSLRAITISDSNPYFNIIDDVLYNESGTNLYYYLHSKTQESFELPTTVDTIMPRAFAQNPNLKTLTMSRSLKYISNRAFESCTSLQLVESMKYVTVIGNRAFAGCTALTGINGGERLGTIGDEAFMGCIKLREFPFSHGMLTVIGDHAFKGCTSLTVAVLGNMLIGIGDGAFENCSALSKSYLTSTVTSMGQQLFKGCASLSELWLCNTVPPQVGNDFFDSWASITLYVPHDAVGSYRTASPWKNAYQFKTSNYIDNGADVNNDKSVNAYDITLVYSVMLGNTDDGIVGHCDVNHDGSVTAADITIIYDYILTGVDMTMGYRFVNNKNEGVGQYISLSDDHQRIRAFDNNSSAYVMSGLMGVSDNLYVASLTPGTIQSIPYLEIVPHAAGYFTLVLMVNDGTDSHYRAFPIVVR